MNDTNRPSNRLVVGPAMLRDTVAWLAARIRNVNMEEWDLHSNRILAAARQLESSAIETTASRPFYQLLDDYFNALVRGGRQTQIDEARLAIIREYERVSGLSAVHGTPLHQALGSPLEPSEQPPVETGLRTGELAQLRTIDAAARFYVDSVKPCTGLAWENLMNALFDGRPEKAK